jgi:hypothetical protein
VASGGPDAPQSPPPERIPRAARVLALARHWQELIRSGAVRDQAELARLVGVSRARVTQVMNLLWLAPHLQAELLFARTREDHPGERRLRAIAALPYWGAQRSAWNPARV